MCFWKDICWGREKFLAAAFCVWARRLGSGMYNFDCKSSDTSPLCMETRDECRVRQEHGLAGLLALGSFCVSLSATSAEAEVRGSLWLLL